MRQPGEILLPCRKSWQQLEEQGIRAERKSIYDDMETLREFGMEIQYKRGREGGYYQERSADPEIQRGIV